MKRTPPLDRQILLRTKSFFPLKDTSEKQADDVLLHFWPLLATFWKVKMVFIGKWGSPQFFNQAESPA